MSKTTFYCCDPIAAVAAEPHPPRVASITKTWRCDECHQAWKVTVYFAEDGSFQSGEAVQIVNWRHRWKSNWPLAIPCAVAFVYSLWRL
jgi:hypothetical protein